MTVAIVILCVIAVELWWIGRFLDAIHSRLREMQDERKR